MIQILITLGIANYNQGFINIPMAYEQNFGNNDEAVNVYLNNWAVGFFLARINRNANNNNTPRIMMGINYTNWVQANYEIGQNITVTFNNPLHPNGILIQ